MLRLLASKLSLREIAAELYVSFNTVKTHTRAIFPKLGAASRAEAVERARELASPLARTAATAAARLKITPDERNAG
jgi:ATP/maltotriose-dependent transcriptional regulator MalT